MRSAALLIMLAGCAVEGAPQGVRSAGDAVADAAVADAAVAADAQPQHWHARYVQDNCRRCPECCVEIEHAPVSKRKKAATVRQQVKDQREQVKALRRQLRVIKRQLKKRGKKNGSDH